MIDRLSGSFTVLHTNDIHGRHRPFRVVPESATSQTGDPGQGWDEFDRPGLVGGFASLATAVERVRRARGEQDVLLLDGGDTFSDDLLGNLTEGEAVIRLMNALGYQFMALGNHDFDYGVERTRALQQIARFPMRGANVIDRSTGEPFLGEPFARFELGGLRVGVLALGYPNTGLTSSPKNVGPLDFTSGLEAARRYLPKLRDQCEVVLVLLHQGTALDRTLAEEVQGIDLIIGAHSHDRIPVTRVGGAWMVQAVSDASVLGETEIRVEDGRVVSVESNLRTLWVDEFPPNERVQAHIEQLRAPYRVQLEEVIAEAEEPIGRNYKSESPFDKLAGDLLRRHTGAQVAFLPGVGYGVTLLAGPVTREALYTLLPHPARVVTLELAGAQILEILEQSATNQAPGDPAQIVGGLVQTAGLRWKVDLTRPVWKRVDSVFVGEEPLEPEHVYSAVTNSGMLSGIHHYHTFQEGQNVLEHEDRMTEVVENALRASGKVRAPELGDITLVKAG